MFNRKTNAVVPATQAAKPSITPEEFNSASTAVHPGGVLSSGVSIKGSIKSRNALLIDGEVEGKINSTGALTIGEHAQIRGEIRAESVKLGGTVEGNIFATGRCELQAGCTLHGDVEAPRLVVDENATFFGSAKIATQK
jgi:cytoskeletal protein CcmA (bactofilin family)